MINTLTLNPALDKILYINNFEKNSTNRIKYMKNVVGGKGTHVSINLKLLGMNNRAFGIAFGDIGKEIINSLNSDGIDTSFIWKDYDNTRINYLIVENNNDSTIIAEKGITLNEKILKELIDIMKKNISNDDFLVFSGDASNCNDTNIYNSIANEFVSKNIKIFLDSSGNTLKESLKLSPFLIKPNIDELTFLFGKEIKSQDDILSAIEKLKKYNIKVVAVSLGKHGSILSIDDKIYKAISPKVDVRNTIGCGDSYLSGLIFGFFHKKTIDDILRLATAVSAATAESELSVGFNIDRMNELLDKVIIKTI